MVRKVNKRYDSIALRNFRRKAITEKGDDFQKEILTCILDSENFPPWLDEKINQPTEGDDIVFPSGCRRLCTKEYIEFPETTMRMYYSEWQDIPLSDAATPGFWAYVTRQAVVEHKIASHDLVLSSKESQPDDSAGRSKIEEALESADDIRSDKMDKLIRNFLRNLCGLHEVRSARSLYQDCPFARAWWQCHVAHKASPNDWHDRILPMLREKPVWEIVSDRMVSGLAVIGDINIRNGVILYLLEQKERKKDDIRDLLARVGVMSGWCALGSFSAEEIKGKIPELFISHNSNGNAQST